MDLDVDEFLRRFLLHVVPDGFVRIRHFGLLANRRRAAALAPCRALLAQPAPPAGPPESVRALMLRLTGIDIERCPNCQQGVLRPARGRAARPAGLGHLVSRCPPAGRGYTRLCALVDIGHLDAAHLRS